MSSPSTSSVEYAGPAGPNPLDAAVEEVLEAHNWVFERRAENELGLKVAGRACGYVLDFVWDARLAALRLTCRFGMRIAEDNFSLAAASASQMNAENALGHVYIDRETMEPVFGYTFLMGDVAPPAARRHVDMALKLAFARCEQAFAAFALLTDPDDLPSSGTLALALMDTAGQA